MASEVVTRALERWNIAKQGWNDIYEKAKDDQKFLSDEPNAMWDNQLLKDRKNRPVYTVDQLSQFVHQVENDERMNTPSIDIIPDDENTDPETAEVWQGIIRGIEYKSNADAAYDTAGSFAIRSSIGFIRVDQCYANNKDFNQELVIKRVVNPQSVYIDPNSIEPDGSDAKWGFVLEEMTVKEFSARFPDYPATDFCEKTTKALQDQDKLTIVEYFEIEENETEYGLTDGGEVQVKDKNGVYKSTRKIAEKKVKHYWLSREDELESSEFPGEYIPLVPIYGEEAWSEGKRNLKSLIRNGKSPQQMFNLGISLDVEMLMKQPQASFMAAAGQVSGFEHEYADPTKANVLHYNQTDVNGDPAPAPQRVAPPQTATGFINLSRESLDNIKGSIGMYNAAIGQKSNETSGVAIQRRNQESDVGNFHFGDNLKRSVTQVGKILVSAGKIVYDTARAVMSVDREDNAKMVGINGHRTKDQERDFHIKDGNFGVRVTTGPSYTTQRQEAAVMYAEALKILPPEAAIQVLDLVFKYQDTAGSQALSARFKKMVNPAFLSKEEIDKDQPDPQIAALTQQLQQVTAEAQTQIQQLQSELQNKQADTAVKAADVQLKGQELELKKGDQQLKQQEMNTKAVLEAKKLEIEQRKVEIEAYTVQKEPQNTAKEQPQAAIKLDTTGFQMMKTPEQLDLEAQELQQEQATAQQSLAQTQAIIQGVSGLQQLVGSLVEQTAMQTQAIVQQTQELGKPITVLRDESGNMMGAI